MNARRVLEERRTVDAEIRAIEAEIKKYQDDGRPKGYSPGSTAEKVPGTQDEYVDVGRSTNNVQAMRSQQEEGHRQRLGRLLADKRMIILDAERVINALEDGMLRSILRYYYCQGWTDSAIGEALMLSQRNVCVKRNKAVDFLEKNL